MRICRVDANQKEIVKGLRKCGVSVTPTHMVGDGFVDLVCGWNGLNYLLEVKDGDKPLSARKLTKDEDEWHKNWRGKSYVVKNLEEALEAIMGKSYSNNTVAVR
jgi:hypothetical protein